MDSSRHGWHLHLWKTFQTEVAVMRSTQKWKEHFSPKLCVILCYPGLNAVLCVPGVILGLLLNRPHSLSGIRSHLVGQLRKRNSLALIFPLSVSFCFLALCPILPTAKCLFQPKWKKKQKNKTQSTNQPNKQKQEKPSCMARATHEEGWKATDLTHPSPTWLFMLWCAVRNCPEKDDSCWELASERRSTHPWWDTHPPVPHRHFYGLFLQE